MMPERNISIAFTAISGAIVIPAYSAALRHQPHDHPVALTIGLVVGALGVSLGSLMAQASSHRVLRVSGLLFWSLLALGVAGGGAIGVMNSSGWAARVLFGALTLLPVAGPAAVMLKGEG